MRVGGLMMPAVTRHVALCAMVLPVVLHAQLLLNTRSLSGEGADNPTAIATDAQGNVYVAGTTNSPDFPLSHALVAQFPEPALRVATDGRTFAAANPMLTPSVRSTINKMTSGLTSRAQLART